MLFYHLKIPGIAWVWPNAFHWLPVDSAFVCLFKDNGIWLGGFRDVSYPATPPPPPFSDIFFWVTCTDKDTGRAERKDCCKATTSAIAPVLQTSPRDYRVYEFMVVCCHNHNSATITTTSWSHRPEDGKIQSTWEVSHASIDLVWFQQGFSIMCL